jgi:hypothetical protein
MVKRLAVIRSRHHWRASTGVDRRSRPAFRARIGLGMLFGKHWRVEYSHSAPQLTSAGGYEGGGEMIYGSHPGPWSDKVEDTIMGKVMELNGRLKR